MEIEFDRRKRDLTLNNRGLDFARAGEVFADFHLTIEDRRFDYGEARYQTLGRLDGVVIMVVWTPRSQARRIISMRRCHAQAREDYERRRLDRSG
ncbi:MAG: BrnT family toxin [Caulobacteraceae bacterium]